MSSSYRHQRGLQTDTAASPKAIRASLAEGIEPEIDSLHRLSTSRRALEIVGFATLYVAGAFAMKIFGGTVAGFVAAVLLMGLAINSCGLLIHEGLHGVLAKGRRANRVASFLVGLPIMTSATAYRITHTYHHFELGKRRDLGTYQQHSGKDRFVWLAYFAQLCAGCVLYILLVPYFAWKFGSSKSRRSICVEYAIIAAVYFAFFRLVPGSVILTYWFLPLLVMNILTNVRGIASHALGDSQNPFLASRTISCPRWLSWLLLHENYHLEHHLFPKIPSYHLPRLHRLVWKKLPQAAYSSSYLRFLTGFIKAACKRDLQPMGVVHPSKKC